jgi:superoxide dismutase
MRVRLVSDLKQEAVTIIPGTPFTFPSSDRNMRRTTSVLDSFNKFHKGGHFDEKSLLQPAPSVTHEGEIIPLLNLNLWEHAYLKDYELNREAYVNNFFKNINWNVVLDRIPSKSW